MELKTAADSNFSESEESPETKGIRILEGDPKKAIIKLAVPMIVAMSVQTLYQLIDTFWSRGSEQTHLLQWVSYFHFIS